MLKVKSQKSKVKTKIQNSKFLILSFGFAFCILYFAFTCYGQQGDDLEFTLDVTSNTIPTPKIFRPDIDLSGRGLHQDVTWPQAVAAKEVLDTWRKDIGFAGMYRIQYDLWEIDQLSKNKDLQNSLLANYEKIINNISDAGGIVILDIFGTPAGMGRVLDKKSPPKDLKAFKELVKGIIRDLSCNKRYNIWYEVWSTPDMDDFFLGRKQDYLNLYRVVAESIKELESETTKIHIPLGGPSTSWWFQNLDGNTIVTAEKSLIYEFIKFCYHYRLPLDFIAWHGYSTDPKADKEITIYKKAAVTLIRDWLSYFHFDRDTPMIIDEWNYDRNANVLPERKENSFVSASYIPSRLKDMYEAGIDHQLYFCLEDFQNNKEGVVRNVGIFSYNPQSREYKGSPKSIYNAFRMFSLLGKEMFLPKLDDEFVGAIATKEQDTIALLVYNYIDPDIATNYLSRNIAGLNSSARKSLLNIIGSQKLEKIMLGEIDISKLRATNRVKGLLKRAQELNDKAKKFTQVSRNIKIDIKNLRDDYLYLRYAVDSSCSLDCAFEPIDTKEINSSGSYQEMLKMGPYSINLIVLRKKPKQPQHLPPIEEKTLVSGEIKLPLGNTTSGITESTNSTTQ